MDTSLPPHFFHAFPADTQKLPAAEADGTVKLRLFSAGKEAGHRKGGHGFAAARLSHQSQDFSLSHMEVHIVKNRHHALPGGKGQG